MQLYTFQDGYIQKRWLITSDENVKKSEPSYTIGGKIK